jgi:hypothetical protein
LPPGFIPQRIIKKGDMSPDIRDRLMRLYKFHIAKSKNQASLHREDQDYINLLLASSTSKSKDPELPELDRTCEWLQDASISALDAPQDDRR